MSFVIKILGLVDIIAALAILFGNFQLFGIGIILGLVLAIKGCTSLFADWTARIYGIVDIVAAFMLFFGGAPFLINIVIVIVLVYKGLFSML